MMCVRASWLNRQLVVLCLQEPALPIDRNLQEPASLLDRSSEEGFLSVSPVGDGDDDDDDTVDEDDDDDDDY